MRREQLDRRTARPRVGLTLVELMVVVTILVLLVAVTLPMMQPLLEGREVREAARQIDTYFAQAKSRAMAIGRPVGVLFEYQIAAADEMYSQLGLSSANAFQMSIVETPLPFAGDEHGARAEVSRSNGIWSATLFGADVRPPGFINAGDLIRFNYRGPYYPINGPMPVLPKINFRSQSASGEPLADAPITDRKFFPGDQERENRMPFQILRRPRRTSSFPVELPVSSTVDLTLSGMGVINDLGTFGRPRKGLAIMFSPTGRVEQIYFDLEARPRLAVDSPVNEFTINPQRPTGTIFLLVGRVDKVGAVDEATANTPANLWDTNSLWIAINHRTGQVTTYPNNVDWPANSPLPVPQKLVRARQLAATGQGLGG